MSWWTDQPDARLSQGDVLRDIPIASAVHPLVAVRYRDGKGGNRFWYPAAVDDKAQLIAKGSVGLGIVLSHSCDLDKNESKGVALVAPVRLAANLAPEHWLNVMAQRRRSLLPLPDVPSNGDCYADLRMMTFVDRRFLTADNKLASMTEAATERLQNQLFAFFVRPEDRGDLATAASNPKDGQ